MTRDDMRNLDIGITTAVGTLVEALGMQAENQVRASCGTSPAYGEDAFLDLLKRTGCYSSLAIERWRE